MIWRCRFCDCDLTEDEALGHGEMCEKCEIAKTRRWDDREVCPTKFTQRLAVVLAIAVIAACVVVMKKLGGG